MSDLEALKFAPFCFIICGLLSLGLTLTFGASLKFGIGLTLITGTMLWCTTIAYEAKERNKK